MQKEDQLPRRNLIWPFRKEKNNEKIIEENKESQPSNITRRSILAGALGTVLFVLSRKAFARNFLKISYKVHKSRLLNKKEYSLKIPVHKGLSYYGLAELYTGNQTNGLYIQNFNDNLKLFYGRNQYIYIPVRLLRPILRKVLEENNFARFIIDNEEEDKINNLWDIAVGFMNNSLSVQEKIDILLMLNDEIDPNTKIVYDEQYIIVPDSLIEKRLIDEEIPKPTPAPTIKPIPKIPPTLRKRQNPYRVDISVIKKRLRPRDLFGARRIRSLGRGRYLIRKHTGLDLVSPIGTNLYAVSPGIVTEVYYYKKGQHSLWRNGKTLRYKTDSGLLITYLHLKEYNIKPGQRINLNTLLGKVGITGNADKSNPHVHIQVKKATVIDPYPYVVVDTEWLLYFVKITFRPFS